jgi:hypothetical protein
MKECKEPQEDMCKPVSRFLDLEMILINSTQEMILFMYPVHILISPVLYTMKYLSCEILIVFYYEVGSAREYELFHMLRWDDMFHVKVCMKLKNIRRITLSDIALGYIPALGRLKGLILIGLKCQAM